MDIPDPILIPQEARFGPWMKPGPFRRLRASPTANLGTRVPTAGGTYQQKGTRIWGSLFKIRQPNSVIIGENPWHPISANQVRILRDLISMS